MQADGRLDFRRSERIDLEGDVTLRVYLTRTDDVREIEASLVNAGVGGLRVLADGCDVPLGTLADLEIRLDGALLAASLALVRWVEPNGRGIGLEFFYTTDEERDALRLYLMERQRASGSGELRAGPTSEPLSADRATIGVDTPLSHH